MANDWMFFLYNFLVGCTPEGQLETETGVAKEWEMTRDGLCYLISAKKALTVRQSLLGVDFNQLT